jgi:hypothetical protein
MVSHLVTYLLRVFPTYSFIGVMNKMLFLTGYCWHVDRILLLCTFLFGICIGIPLRSKLPGPVKLCPIWHHLSFQLHPLYFICPLCPFSSLAFSHISNTLTCFSSLCSLFLLLELHCLFFM